MLRLVNLGIRCCGSAFEEIKVATQLGLPYVIAIEFSVAALVLGCGRLPGVASFCQFFVGHLQNQSPCRDVDGDQIAVLDLIARRTMMASNRDGK